jgi:omega-amidase
VRVALVSLNQKWLDKPANQDRCLRYLDIAKSKSCNVVIFPEMTLTGYSMDIEEIAEPDVNSPTLKFFEKASKDNYMYIVSGAPISRNNATYFTNSLCLASPDGGANIVYEKIHPFSFAGENKFYTPGQHLGFMDISGMRFGAAICYDLRFPEIFSAMARKIDAFIVIANWPKKRIDHWFGLLKARAIENQCYAIGVNRISCDGNGIEYEKSTVIFDPLGIKLNPVGSDGDMDIYDLDRSLVEKYREEFPVIADKRYSFYRNLYKGLM